MRKIFGIGTGPGDPELLTLKAVKTMKESQVIFAPNNKGTNMALDTAKEFIKDKKIVLIDFPMGAVTREDYIKAARIIEEEIPKGGQGSFLTIGDPMIYSTFIYIMEELNKEIIEAQVVSGIPSFVAGAAIAKTPLTVKGDNFYLCDELDERLMEDADSLAILKTLKGKEDLLEALEKNGFQYKYIKKISLEDEGILEDREDILEDKNYISLILARKIQGEE